MTHCYDVGYDIQGRFLGMPYDFRLPTLRKIVRRMYQPGGPMMVPKVWGAGWTINLAHPGGKWMLAATLVTVVVALFAG